MQVPILNRQVEQNPTLLSAPEISKAIPGAFGEDVAVATEKLGNSALQAGDSLARHIQWQNFQKGIDQVYEAHSKFANGLKDNLYSTDMEDIKNADGTIKTNPDGTPMQQPVGILNRKGFGATGSALEVKQQAESMIQQAKSTLPNNPIIQRMFDRYASSTLDSVYNAAVEHEAKEWRNGSITLKNSTIANMISQAELAQTPELLSKTIDNVAYASNQKADFAEMDDETRQKTINDAVTRTMQSAIMGKLNASGSADDARALLDGVKEKIPEETYDKLDAQITARGDVLERKANLEAAKQKISDRFDTINQLATGKIDMSNVDSVIMKLSKDDPELGEAVQKVIDNDGKLEASAEDESYQNLVKKIFSSGTKEEVSKFLIEALHARGNSQISKDRLAILVQAATDRANSLPTAYRVGQWQGEKFVPGSPMENLKKQPSPTQKENTGDGSYTPKQNVVDAAIHSISQWGEQTGIKIGSAFTNFFQGIKDGKHPQQAHDDAIKQAIIEGHPEAAMQKEPPNMVVTSQGNTRLIFPKTTTVYPNRIYNPKTRQLELNKNRERSNRE